MRIYDKKVTLGNFSKTLSKYKLIPLDELMNNIEDATDMQHLYSCFSGLTDPQLMLKLYFLTLDDPKLKKFLINLTNEEVDLDRYILWKEYRLTNATDSHSETYYKLKFGSTWQQRKEEVINARQNPYDPKDVMAKHKCSLKEAELLVQELKDKTKPSIEKMGEEKFNFVVRRHKNYLDYWIKVHDNNLESAVEAFTDYKQSSSTRSVKYWTKRGYSEEEAKLKVSETQRKNSGLHREYYEIRGYKDSEIDEIMASINQNKDSSSWEFFLKKYDGLLLDKIKTLWAEHCQTKSSYFRQFGIMIKDREDFEKVEIYYQIVYSFTKRSLLEMEPCPGIRGKNTGDYHLDHIFSIHEGYKAQIPPIIIGSVINLQWLLAEENCSKKANCYMTKNELIKKYEDYLNESN